MKKITRDKRGRDKRTKGDIQDFIESGYADKWYKDGGYCE